MSRTESALGARKFPWDRSAVRVQNFESFDLDSTEYLLRPPLGFTPTRVRSTRIPVGQDGRRSRWRRRASGSLPDRAAHADWLVRQITDECKIHPGPSSSTQQAWPITLRRIKEGVHPGLDEPRRPVGRRYGAGVRHRLAPASSVAGDKCHLRRQGTLCAALPGPRGGRRGRSQRSWRDGAENFPNAALRRLVPCRPAAFTTAVDQVRKAEAGQRNFPKAARWACSKAGAIDSDRPASRPRRARDRRLRHRRGLPAKEMLRCIAVPRHREGPMAHRTRFQPYRSRPRSHRAGSRLRKALRGREPRSHQVQPGHLPIATKSARRLERHLPGRRHAARGYPRYRHLRHHHLTLLAAPLPDIFKST